MTTLHGRFQDAAGSHPSRKAVVTSDAVKTYHELLEESLAVASCLADQGVRPGDRVGICMEKGTDVPVALFGTMLAGGVCVPVDVGTPMPRMTAILEDAGATALVSTWSPRLSPPPLPTLRAVVLHGAPGEASTPASVTTVRWEEICRRSSNEAPPGTKSNTEDLAYILYTSGSTGRPKGVAISHRAALAFVDWASDAVVLSPEDRVSNHASLGFDLSVFDVYATLLGGATLYPVPEMQRGMPRYLSEMIRDNALTIWYSVPSIVARIAALCAKGETNLPSVRHLICAGEPFPKQEIAAMSAAFPNARIHNWYGPTETNVVTFHEVTPADQRTDAAVPIGRPCPYADVRILADDLTEVPPGERGILHVAGSTLLTSYWGDDERTRAAVRALPSGGAYYCTGDLARCDAEGVLHFFGRRDDMVKVSGYRVEPGEIEHALLDSGLVEEAAVVPLKRGEETSLVAVVVSQSSADDLTRACRHRLPTYMVPRTVVFVDRIPRNDRGKVDRAALSSLVGEGGSS